MTLFGKSEKNLKASGSPGKRCYVIGDVHGRLDLLQDLLGLIERHNASRPGKEAIVVMLGDLIDRGPDSRGVIEFFMRGLSFPARLVLLKGNHEDMLVRGLAGEHSQLHPWLSLGGYECARSYGVEIGGLFGREPEYVAHVLSQSIPAEHIAFMSGFLNSARFGDYLFVHAGVRPGVPLAEQSPEDMRWIRKGFLESRADHGYVVVHGHSVSAEVEERPNRIGIDTGAWKTGALTAVWIEESERGFLQAVGPAANSP